MLIENPRNGTTHWLNGRGDASVCGLVSIDTTAWFGEAAFRLGNPEMTVCRFCRERLDWDAALKEWRREKRAFHVRHDFDAPMPLPEGAFSP